MKTHSEEIYGKSTQGTQCKSLHFALYTATVRLLLDWLIEQGLTSPPTQYRLSGRQFTGRKTQPTVSKYWRKICYKSKENPEKANNTKDGSTIKRHTKNTASPLVYTLVLWGD